MKEDKVKLTPNSNQFELLGYDFMIDQNMKLYLIEVNTNPCLETPCPLLQKLISNTLDQTFKICVDPFLCPSDFVYENGEMTAQEFKVEEVYQGRWKE